MIEDFPRGGEERYTLSRLADQNYVREIDLTELPIFSELVATGIRILSEPGELNDFGRSDELLNNLLLSQQIITRRLEGRISESTKTD